MAILSIKQFEEKVQPYFELLTQPGRIPEYKRSDFQESQPSIFDANAIVPNWVANEYSKYRNNPNSYFGNFEIQKIAQSIPKPPQSTSAVGDPYGVGGLNRITGKLAGVPGLADIYDAILREKNKPIAQQIQQTQQSLNDKYNQIQQKYNSPEARQLFQQEYQNLASQIPASDVDAQNNLYNSYWNNIATAEQRELDAFTREQNRTLLALQEQTSNQNAELTSQLENQVLDVYNRIAQGDNLPVTFQDILGAFDLAPKTPGSDFLTGRISAQEFRATQPTSQTTAQQAQPVTQQAQPVAQPVTQPVAQPATPAESPFLTGTAPVTTAPAATTAMTAPVTAAAPVTTAATAAPMATTLGTTMTPTSMDIAAQPISAGIGGQQAMPQTFLTGTATQPTGLTPESLPALRGSASGQSAVDPTLRPYLELGLRGAEQLFLQQAPSLYPGQMYVSPSQQTLDALAQTEAIARAQPSALQAAQESYMAGLGGLGFTAGGGFLGSNPFQQRAIEAATRPIMQQFEQTTLPTIAGQFSAAGRYGSGAMGRITGQAQEASSRALGDVAANIAYTDYARERGLQDAAIRNQLQASTLAPQIYGQQFLPAQQLAQVGAAREAIAAQPLQEAISRYQYQQQLPYQQLGGFLSSIYGTPLAGSQYQTPAQAQTNRAGSALGLAATGAGIGNLIGGTTGAGYGAVLGGLAGLLG